MSENNLPGVPAADAGPRPEVIAAAEAARVWIRERRASWATLAADAPVVSRTPIDDAAEVRLTLEPADDGASQTMVRPGTDTPYDGGADAASQFSSSANPLGERETALKADTTYETDSAVASPRQPDFPELPAQAAAIVSDTALDIVAEVRPAFQSLRTTAGRWMKHAGVAALLVLVAAGISWVARGYHRKIAAAPTTGTAVLESAPAGSEVQVDGMPAGTTPVSVELTAGRHNVEFKRRNGTRDVAVDIVAGRSTLERLDWNAKGIGRLQVTSDPVGAKVIVDGRERGVAPLVIDGLTEGSHVVVLQDAKGSVRRTVAITADHTSELAQSIYAGWVHVSSPIDLTISEGTQALRPDERNLIMLPPGSHALLVENRALAYREERQVNVTPGEMTRLALVPPPSSITVTASIAAEVTIDGERAGDTPLASHAVPLGTREVVVKAAGGAERRFTITVTTAPVRLDVDFSRP